MKLFSRLYIIAMLLIFSSCEEIVNLDLNTSELKDVIDASISDNSPCYVYLSRSQSFSNNSPYQTISGAIIELSDSKGNKEIIRESKEPGLYISLMTGVVGRTYDIKITIGENIYEAQSRIPSTVPIDDIYIYNIRVGGDDWLSPCIVYNDPPDEDNYYYTMMYVNGHMMKSIYLNDDDYRNGLTVERILYFDKEDNSDNELEVGDHISVEMQTLDKGMYTFYKSLYSVAAGGATNPLTNFSGGALGCFKAYGSSYADITISENNIRSAK